MAPRRLLLQVEICLMVIVGAAPSRVLAQGGQSGSIVGSVFDSGGTPLRGVKVSASSETHIGGARVSYSNEQGFFRLPALEPGVFQLRASAPRLKSVVVKDVRVGISAPMEVNLVMEVESATEEVAVVERAPLISTTRANVREVFDLDMVEGLPHGSRDNVHSQVVNDVAGGMNGRIRGGATNQTIYMQDGFDIRGQVPTLKTSAAYEVNTGGYGVDNPMASGGSINMVTKSGSNRHEFEFNATADTHWLRLGTDSLDSPNPTFLYFINPLVSGPIIKDRLWFLFNTEVYFQQIGRDRDVEGFFPDPPPYRKWVPKGTAKLTWQVTARNKLQSLTNFDFPFEQNRRAALGIDRDAQEDRRGRRLFQGLIWESLLTDSFVFRSQVGFTSVPMHIYPRLCADRPVECDHIPAVVQRFPRRQESQNNSSHQRDDLYALQFQNRFNWFLADGPLGEHVIELKDNFYSEQDIRRLSRPGDMVTEYNGNVPAQRTTYFSNDPRLEPARFGWSITSTTASRHTATVSDSWRPTRHLTLTPALSHIWARGSNSRGHQPVSHSTFAPAASVAWDITHDGRTVLRASYNQYVDLDVAVLARHTVGGMAQQRCDWNAATEAFDGNCEYSGGASLNTFGLPCGPTGVDERGRTCREKLVIPRTQEYTMGAERELVPGLALALDLFHRNFRRPYELRETNRIWANGESLAFTGGYRNGRRETILDLGTPTGASRLYQAATVGASKREGRLKLKASYTLSRLEGNVFDGINNAWGDIGPRDVYLYGNLPDDHRHEMKLSSTVQINSWMSAGVRYRYFSGRPYSRRFRNDLTGSYDLYRARVGENINDPGDDRSLRLPDMQDLNTQLRVNLAQLTGQRLELYVDVLNVLGLRTTTEIAEEDGRDFGIMRSRLEPLRVRLGVNYRY
jgi:hypothetical protein